MPDNTKVRVTVFSLFLRAPGRGFVVTPGVLLLKSLPQMNVSSTLCVRWLDVTVKITDLHSLIKPAKLFRASHQLTRSRTAKPLGPRQTYRQPTGSLQEGIMFVTSSSLQHSQYPICDLNKTENYQPVSGAKTKKGQYSSTTLLRWSTPGSGGRRLTWSRFFLFVGFYHV